MACDDLYWGTDVGSDYEAYGATCGGRNEFDGGTCETRCGSGGTGGDSGADPTEIPANLPPGQPAPTGDADFQDSADGCEAGYMVLCDILKLAALAGDDPTLEQYAEYGYTCGGRNGPSETACTELYPA